MQGTDLRAELLSKLSLEMYIWRSPDGLTVLFCFSILFHCEEALYACAFSAVAVAFQLAAHSVARYVMKKAERDLTSLIGRPCFT